MQDFSAKIHKKMKMDKNLEKFVMTDYHASNSFNVNIISLNIQI